MLYQTYHSQQLVKVVWHKGASPPHMDGSLVFDRLRQCAPYLYVLPWAHPSPQPKRHLDRFNRFAGLTTVTDRATDRQTDRPRFSVCNNRPHLCCTAMWPKRHMFYKSNTKLFVKFHWFNHRLMGHGKWVTNLTRDPLTLFPLTHFQPGQQPTPVGLRASLFDPLGLQAISMDPRNVLDRHISVTVWPIVTKFGTMTRIDPFNPVGR